MKKPLKIILILAAAFMLALSKPFAQQSHAVQIIRQENAVTVAADEVIEDDLIIAAERAEIEGTINGDLFVAAGEVSINGTVQGDLFTAGGMVDVSGTVAQDVRIAGGNITLDEAQIGDGVIIMGGSTSIDEDTSIGGSLLWLGGTLRSEADVVDGIAGAGGQVNLSGSIGKNTHLAVGSLIIDSDANLQGDLVYQSDQKLDIDEEAVVTGEITEATVSAKLFADKQMDQKVVRRRLREFSWGMRVWSYFSALVVGLILVSLFPKLFDNTDQQLKQKFLASLGWGVLVLVLAFPVLLILSITVIGLPLAMILGLMLALELYLAKIFAGFAIGQWLKKTAKLEVSRQVVLAGGLLVYYLLRAIPVVNMFTGLLAVTSVIGALFALKKQRVSK